MDCKIAFLAKCLDNSYCRRIVAGAVGCFIILRGMSLMEMPFSLRCLHLCTPHLHLGPCDFYRSHCLWIASCHYHYLHQRETRLPCHTRTALPFLLLSPRYHSIGVAKSSTDLPYPFVISCCQDNGYVYYYGCGGQPSSC